ncbi:helix-turn-helix domain-containing protein, partial [Escherichia coli]|nr:helix-turn-helix domain-containing protein [Escherichia coli]
MLRATKVRIYPTPE